MAYLLGIASPITWERCLQLFSRPLITGDLLQVAAALTLAYPYGSPQVLSSYAYSSHGQGAPKAAVHSENGSLNCGQQAWYCQHRWPEISGMVSSNAMPHSRTKSFMLHRGRMLHWLCLQSGTSCAVHRLNVVAISCKSIGKLLRAST